MVDRRRIVIVGGGFAGVACARTLRRKLSREHWDVVLFNRENHMVFHPMLAEVAGGSLNPDAVAAPLRQMLPRVHCRTEDVTSVDLDAKQIVYTAHDGRSDAIDYDHIVLACGATVNLGMVPGMADHAFPLKTVGDAVNLRAHVMQQLERAEVCDDPVQRRWYLSFVVVGGGYSGVEAAGEINDLARGTRRFFSNVREDEITVSVIHSRAQLLPEIGEKLREFAREKMEKAGIRVLLERRVALATPRGVGLADGSIIEGATIVCTIGTSPSPIIQTLATQVERGRVVADADLRIKGRVDAWVIGDCAAAINAHDGEPCPPTGQFAERQGKQAAANLLRVLRGEATRPFSFKPVGQLCAIGGHSAVAEILGLRLSGFVAWFLWRSIYLMKLPSWSRRIKVGFDWAWQLVFSRDLSHLKTDVTARVSKAYYRAGDFVFAEGDPASDFYVIERGEVEVVRATGDGEQLLAVLGAGDFFGEMAILTNEPRNASVRARTAVEVVVMGRGVFERVSSSLSPLKDVLAAAMHRRRREGWIADAETRAKLLSLRVADVTEPVDDAAIPVATNCADVLRHFRDHRLGFACLVEGDGRIAGVLQRRDLLRLLETNCNGCTNAIDLAQRHPVCVTSADSALTAADAFREHEVDWLPVIDDAETRRLVGIVQSQAMLSRIIR